LLYTDGVTEATSKHDTFFGDDRLLKEVRERPDASAQEVVSRVNAAIKTFTQGAPQSDDITMLSIQYFGPEGCE